MPQVHSEFPGANGADAEAHSPHTFWALTLGSMGVVFGDIGTSPLYAFRVALQAAAGPSNIVTREGVLGVLSLILWALILVVTCKYVLILLRADNKGEGGTLSLMALAQGALGQGRIRFTMLLLGMIAAALFYGDALITPAISVLSAVEGLEVGAPHLREYVVPLTVIILLALFSVQSRGTARVAAFFGPVMTLWFVTIGGVGLVHIADDPSVFAALNPMHAIRFLASHGYIGLVTLGAVFLAVTGAEALYADLGHFGRRPIQTAWLYFVFPALVLNYFGQGALVLAEPTAIGNPFYRMVPSWALYPMIALATAATIIASQAVITGAFSLTNQAVQLGLLPRLQIRRTSATQAGQIFIPRINVLLLIGVLLLGYRVPLVECACLGLWRGRHRHHAGRRVDGLHRDLEGVELVARCCACAHAALHPDRLHLPHRQPAQGPARRMGTASHRRLSRHRHAHLAQRCANSRGQDAKAGNARRGADQAVGEKAAAARSRAPPCS